VTAEVSDQVTRTTAAAGSSRVFLLLGAAAALLAVLLGAIGTHVLAASATTEQMAGFQTANQFQFYHALGLLLIGLLAYLRPGEPLLQWCGWAMTAGIILFCGGIYGHVLLDLDWLVAVAPLGGISLLLAWVLLIMSLVARGPLRGSRRGSR
jgi:uncharacterized membrane protein YgdD (TMEM256/DUF423 family)